MADVITKIPMTAIPQRFRVDMAGAEYEIVSRWNGAVSSWVLDLYDQNREPMIMCIPMVCGIDLLSQYGYLNIGAELWVLTDGDDTAPPTIDNLGAESNLFLVVRGE